jgi:pyruvate/2-oxoglutarate/acetoin dehydrogenase E1 component
MAAAEELAAQGLDAEVIDLRTLVPPDMEAVMASVEKTGRLIVAAEDRSFAGFVRSIQGMVVDSRPGTPTRALGQKNIPGIAQCLALEEATVLTQEDIVVAARSLMEQPSVCAPVQQSYIPPRYFLS